MRKLLSGEQNEGQKATFRLLACWPVGLHLINLKWLVKLHLEMKYTKLFYFLVQMFSPVWASVQGTS